MYLHHNNNISWLWTFNNYLNNICRNANHIYTFIHDVYIRSILWFSRNLVFIRLLYQSSSTLVDLLVLTVTFLLIRSWLCAIKTLVLVLALRSHSTWHSTFIMVVSFPYRIIHVVAFYCCRLFIICIKLVSTVSSFISHHLIFPLL